MKASQQQRVFGRRANPDVAALRTVMPERTETEHGWGVEHQERQPPAGQTRKAPKRPMNREVSVQLHALRILTESTDALLSSQALSDQAKAEVLEKTVSLVQDIFQACQHHIPFEETLQHKAQALQQQTGDLVVPRPKPGALGHPPDFSTIPLWRGRKQDGMPLDFLKAHYGRWLSAFGAEQDIIFQDQIRARDPRLLQGIANQLHEEGQGRKLRDFVKPRAVRTERELASFDLSTLRQAHRIKGLLHRQRLKQAALKNS